MDDFDKIIENNTVEEEYTLGEVIGHIGYYFGSNFNETQEISKRLLDHGVNIEQHLQTYKDAITEIIGALGKEYELFGERTYTHRVMEGTQCQ